MPDLLLALLAGLAGGAYGAAIGGNWAFVVVAILAPVCWTISAVTGSPVPLDAVAFGPFFGPHVAFAGGAAGTIYAARHGLIPSGRLVNLSLGPLRNPRVLLVGAAFGALGVLVAAGVRLIPWFGSHTDAVAVTVTLSAFAARFAFGDKTFVNRAHFNTATSWPRVMAPTAEHCWLPRQEQPRHFLLLGALVGGIAGVVTLVLAALAPDAAGSANVVMFGVSGWAIIALQLGHPGWVTHPHLQQRGPHRTARPAAHRGHPRAVRGAQPAVGVAAVVGFDVAGRGGGRCRRRPGGSRGRVGGPALPQPLGQLHRPARAGHLAVRHPAVGASALNVGVRP